MERQIVDHLTDENLVRIDSLKALTQGYLLNCRCEGKSPKAVEFYGNNPNHFLWWLEQQGYTDDPAKIGPQSHKSLLNLC